MASLGGMQASNGGRFRSHSLLADQQESASKFNPKKPSESLTRMVTADL